MPCVFCGYPETTNEHVFPGWLRDAIGGPGAIRHEWIAPEGSGSDDREWRTDRLSLTSNTVCQKRCNGGWMNDLEGSAKPFLLPMIQGRGRMLYRHGAQTVAHWALKTALMVDLAQEREHRCIPASDYPALYETEGTLPGTFVWLGACKFGAGIFARGRSLRRRDDPEGPGGYGTTMHIGHLVIESIRIEAAGDAGLRLEGPLAPSLQLAWPWREPVRWPDGEHLSRDQVVAFPEVTAIRSVQRS